VTRKIVETVDRSLTESFFSKSFTKETLQKSKELLCTPRNVHIYKAVEQETIYETNVTVVIALDVGWAVRVLNGDVQEHLRDMLNNMLLTTDGSDVSLNRVTRQSLPATEAQA
jgi:hypothetical protein